MSPSLEERVSRLRSLFPANLSPKPDEKLQIPSRDEGRTIPVHAYRPQTRDNTPSPVLVNFHGGGFILETHGWDEDFARRVVRKSGFTVLDVDYRVSPEHPFPAAVHDTEDAIKWVLSWPAEFDLSRLAVSGFSAGGNLALVACSALFPPGTFSHVIAMYPVTDLATYAGDKTTPDSGAVEEHIWIHETFMEAYLPVGVDKKGPLVSPSFSAGAAFPDKVLMITASEDTLAKEAEDLGEKIRAVGGKNVVVRRMEGVSHAWDKQNPEVGSVGERATNEAYDLAAEMLLV